MQEENNKNNIKTFSFGCRLNALECEKIKKMLNSANICGVLINTCSVTAEAERQSGQFVRKVARENPNIPIFVTGCGATRNPNMFLDIPNTHVILNKDKLNLSEYINVLNKSLNIKYCKFLPEQDVAENHLSKQFIQIQNGCNHECTYCITRILRGPSVSFEYADILQDVQDGVKNGFNEFVLTGIDAASYIKNYFNKPFLISDLCEKLLYDVPGIKRLRLSSVDPAVPAIFDIINLMKTSNRFMPHLHLSMQSGADTILRSMRRRHTADMVRKLVAAADDKISFSWDIICGFPGETDELFQETLDLVRELKPIKIHAFPYSVRPGTVAAEMPNQVNRAISKKRVKIITELAQQNMRDFMKNLVGGVQSVLVESDNIGRTPDDIPVKILGCPIPERTICDVKITKIQQNTLVAERV